MKVQKSKSRRYLLGAAVFILIVYSCTEKRQPADRFDSQREEMVKYQIERRGIEDTAILRAMRKVERHLFVPDKYIGSAYDDGPVPIGYGQTISQPYIVAYMTELIKPKRGDKILEIGTGSGYQAAVLAEVTDSVYTIEIIRELGESASERLSKLGYGNVNVKIGDGFYGWHEHAPFDAIVVTAASEYIPPPLINQLKDGGKMVIPVGMPFQVQMLMAVEKKGEEIVTENLIPVRFVPMKRQ